MKKFNRKKLLNDNRIIQAKELINETISEYQNSFLENEKTEIKTIKNELKNASKLRGGKLFFPYISSGLGKVFCGQVNTDLNQHHF